MSCSLTTIAVGVMADFTSDFSLDACHTIVDVAKDGCAAAGVAKGAPGAGIFNGIWGILKILIGAAGHALPITEMMWAILEILLDAALELFPNLVADGADLLAFALTMSDAGAKLIVMYEALLDPMFDDLTDVIGNDMKSGIGTHVPVNATRVPNPGDTRSCPGYVESEDACSIGNVTQLTDRLTSGTVTKDDIAYTQTASCGCTVPPVPCDRGVGTVGCSTALGTYSKRIEEEALLRSNAVEGECATWPECTPRVMGNDVEDTSQEFTVQCIATQNCKMLIRRPNPPSTDTQRDFSDTFGGFSLREGLRTVGTATPGRRRCAEGQRDGGMPWSDDCDPVFSKYTKGRQLLQADTDYVPRYRDMILASRGIRVAMEIREGSYANEQFHGMRRDMGELFTLMSRAKETIGPFWTWERPQQGRTLLSAADDIKCLVNSVSSSGNLRPNTYPCCRGRW
jgi:hypothetical protein